jgi:hypothetical protein
MAVLGELRRAADHEGHAESNACALALVEVVARPLHADEVFRRLISTERAVPRKECCCPREQLSV